MSSFSSSVETKKNERGSVVVATLKGGSEWVEVNLFGATVTSWTSNGRPLLFVSSKSLFDNKKPIRGGIPLVFPQFGPWDGGRPQHGFARSSTWSLSNEDRTEEDDEVSFLLQLENDETTYAIWPHEFRLKYRVTLKRAQLILNLKVENVGEKEFLFTSLLHTYFRLDDVLGVTVTGLYGLTYTDKTDNMAVKKETQDKVSIRALTDRIYSNTPPVHHISVPSGETVVLEKVNFPDTVLWNPWVDNAKVMSDFGDEEYKNMVCVEAGAVSSPVTLPGHSSWIASQSLTYLPHQPASI